MKHLLYVQHSSVCCTIKFPSLPKEELGAQKELETCQGHIEDVSVGTTRQLDAVSI